MGKGLSYGMGKRLEGVERRARMAFVKRFKNVSRRGVSLSLSLSLSLFARATRGAHRAFSMRKDELPYFRPTRKNKKRDSIRSKVFEEEGERFGEGEGKLSPESFPSPSPIFIPSTINHDQTLNIIFNGLVKHVTNCLLYERGNRFSEQCAILCPEYAHSLFLKVFWTLVCHLECAPVRSLAQGEAHTASTPHSLGNLRALPSFEGCAAAATVTLPLSPMHMDTSQSSQAAPALLGPSSAFVAARVRASRSLTAMYGKFSWKNGASHDVR